MPTSVQTMRLAEAKQAVNFTQSAISLGTTNKGAGETTASLFNGKAWGYLFSTGATMIEAKLEGVQATSERGLELMAKNARIYKVGNCQEHAAVAFMFLRARRSVPIQYLGIYTDAGEPLHAIVAIGRGAKKSPLKTPAAKWGKDVVICDAWDGHAYLATDRPIACLDDGCYVSLLCTYSPS